MQGLLTKVVNRARRWAFAPRPLVRPRAGMLRLGTGYGGWVFVDLPELRGSTIVSAGLGEDASFDVEFARRYNARVVLVDPTPRAVAHFAAIEARLGQPAQRGYTADGCQPAEAYALDGLVEGQFRLARKALWDAATDVKFFAPRNPADVSHSIVNYQHAFAEDTPFIVVPAVPLDALLREYAIARLPLIKLDIEGAQHVVIEDMLRKSIRPSQVLVEFDELMHPSRQATAAFGVTDRHLRAAGYAVAHFDGRANFLYVLD